MLGKRVFLIDKISGTAATGIRDNEGVPRGNCQDSKVFLFHLQVLNFKNLYDEKEEIKGKIMVISWRFNR